MQVQKDRISCLICNRQYRIQQGLLHAGYHRYINERRRMSDETLRNGDDNRRYLDGKEGSYNAPLLVITKQQDGMYANVGDSIGNVRNSHGGVDVYNNNNHNNSLINQIQVNANNPISNSNSIKRSKCASSVQVKNKIIREDGEDGFYHVGAVVEEFGGNCMEKSIGRYTENPMEKTVLRLDNKNRTNTAAGDMKTSQKVYTLYNTEIDASKSNMSNSKSKSKSQEKKKNKYLTLTPQIVKNRQIQPIMKQSLKLGNTPSKNQEIGEKINTAILRQSGKKTNSYNENINNKIQLVESNFVRNSAPINSPSEIEQIVHQNASKSKRQVLPVLYEKFVDEQSRRYQGIQEKSYKQRQLKVNKYQNGNQRFNQQQPFIKEVYQYQPTSKKQIHAIQPPQYTNPPQNNNLVLQQFQSQQPQLHHQQQQIIYKKPMTPNILQTPPNQQSHLQPQHQHQNINIMQNQHMIHYSHNQPYPIRSNIINQQSSTSINRPLNNEPVNVKFVQHPHHQQQVSPLSANQAKIQYIQNLHPGQLENYYVLANSPSRNHQPINNQPQIRAHSQPITKKKKQHQSRQAQPKTAYFPNTSGNPSHKDHLAQVHENVSLPTFSAFPEPSIFPVPKQLQETVMKNNEKTSHDKIYITTEDHIPEQTLQNLQNTPKHNPDNIQNSLHEFINKNKLIRTSRHIHEHKIQIQQRSSLGVSGVSKTASGLSSVVPSSASAMRRNSQVSGYMGNMLYDTNGSNIPNTINPNNPKTAVISMKKNPNSSLYRTPQTKNYNNKEDDNYQQNKSRSRSTSKKKVVHRNIQARTNC